MAEDTKIGEARIDFTASTAGVDAGAEKAKAAAEGVASAINNGAEPGAKRLAAAFAKGAAPAAAVLASVDRLWVSIKQSAEAAEQLGAELKSIADAQSISIAGVDEYTAAIRNANSIAEQQNRALQAEIASRSIIVDLVEAAYGGTTDEARRQQIAQARAAADAAIAAKKKNDDDLAAAKDIERRVENIRKANAQADAEAKRAAIAGRKEAEDLNRAAFLDSLEGEERARAEFEYRIFDLRIKLHEASSKKERELLAETISLIEQAEENRVKKAIDDAELIARKTVEAMAEAQRKVIQGVRDDVRSLFSGDDLAVQIQRVGDLLQAIKSRGGGL